jgi:hypothetical protein
MNPNDLWAIPPLAIEGDPDVNTVWQAVGEALSSWEWLEGNLGLIFAELVAARNMHLAASRAYGTIVAFRGRADLVKAAAKAHFSVYPDEATEKDLEKILKTLDRASPRRNDIAHGIAQPHYPRVSVRQWALYPSYFSTGRRTVKGAPNYIMASADIRRFAAQFRDIQAPLGLVLDALWAKRRKS